MEATRAHLQQGKPHDRAIIKNKITIGGLRKRKNESFLRTNKGYGRFPSIKKSNRFPSIKNMARFAVWKQEVKRRNLSEHRHFDLQKPSSKFEVAKIDIRQINNKSRTMCRRKAKPMKEYTQQKVLAKIGFRLSTVQVRPKYHLKQLARSKCWRREKKQILPENKNDGKDRSLSKNGEKRIPPTNQQVDIQKLIMEPYAVVCTFKEGDNVILFSKKLQGRN